MDDARSPSIDTVRIASTLKVRALRRRRREVARAAATEAEILAHQQPARAEAANQHRVDERLGFERRELRVEPRDVGAGDTARPECSILSRIEDKRGGADAFAKNSRGGGSNVSTADGKARSSAASTSRASIA